MWLNSASILFSCVPHRPPLIVILLLHFVHLILADRYQYDSVDDGSEIRCGHPKYARVPCFDDRVKHHLVVQAGRTAVLQCIIYNAKMKAVTWDKKGVGPVAIGDSIFLRDSRYSIRRGRLTDWSLVISAARPSDSGIYRCQINLEKLKEKVFILKVEAPANSVLRRRGGNRRPQTTRLSTDEFLKDQGLRGSETKRKAVVITGRDVVNTGEALVLTCTARYRRPMSVDAALEWYHFGVQKRTGGADRLSIRQRIVNDTALTSILRLEPVTPDSSGPWVCVKRPSEEARRESSQINVTVVQRFYTVKAASKVDEEKSVRTASSCLLPTRPLLLLLLLLQAYHRFHAAPRLHQDGVL